MGYSNLVKNSELNTNFAALAIKAELKAEHAKIVKLQTHVLNYFIDKIFLVDDGSQNMFVYQLIFNMLELKKDKKMLTMLLAGKRKVCLSLNFVHYMALFYFTGNILDAK